MDLDGDGLSVDADERGTADRGEHGDLPDTRDGGEGRTAATSTGRRALAWGCDSYATVARSVIQLTPERGLGRTPLVGWWRASLTLGGSVLIDRRAWMSHRRIRRFVMEIEYLHASKFGNGSTVAGEFKRLMSARGVDVDVHHIREVSKPIVTR